MDELIKNVWAVGGIFSLGWILFILKLFQERADQKERLAYEREQWQEEVKRTERWATIIEGLSNRLDKQK